MYINIPVCTFAPVDFQGGNLKIWNTTMVERKVYVQCNVLDIRRDSIKFSLWLSYQGLTIKYDVNGEQCTYRITGDTAKLSDFRGSSTHSVFMGLPVMLSIRTIAGALRNLVFYTECCNSTFICDLMKKNTDIDELTTLQVLQRSLTDSNCVCVDNEYSDREGFFHSSENSYPTVDFNGLTYDMFISRMENDGWTRLFDIVNSPNFIERPADPIEDDDL